MLSYNAFLILDLNNLFEFDVTPLKKLFLNENLRKFSLGLVHVTKVSKSLTYLLFTNSPLIFENYPSNHLFHKQDE